MVYLLKIVIFHGYAMLNNQMIYRWYTWVYLLKMCGSFHGKLWVITRWIGAIQPDVVNPHRPLAQDASEPVLAATWKTPSLKGADFFLRNDQVWERFLSDLEVSNTIWLWLT